jgi:carbamoyl-phosphate synthase large subunit
MSGLQGKKPTILLTAGGGSSIPWLIRALREKGVRVLTADMNPMAAGLYLADRGFVIPPGKSDRFLPMLRRICKEEQVDAIIPLADEELINATELERDGVIVLLPKKEFIELCLDKYSLMRQLDSFGIPVPTTRLVSQGLGSLNFPLILKPRQGRGSRGIKLIFSEKEFHAAFESELYSPDELIVQQYIDSTKYTISVVIWRDGEVQAVVPKETIYKQGITWLAVARKHSGIDHLCRNIQNSLHADGPMNVQLRLDNSTGIPYVFEINPRYSTTVTLTVRAGIEEVYGLLRQALYGRKDYSFSNWEEGVVLLRQTFDEFMREEDFAKIQVVNYGNIE